MKQRAQGTRLFVFLALFFFVGCATFFKESADSHNAFENGDYDKAAELLDQKAKQEGRDQLLFLLDRGTALQLAGRYKESSKDFILADKLSEVKDYTSLSTEAVTLFFNDHLKEYPGEDFEKVMINALNAINFALMGNFEEARVETRRVNQKLYRYKNEAKREYEQNPFAYYLAGMMWEASGDLDNAYIDYKSTAKLVPDFKYVRNDVLRLAQRLNRPEELKEWSEKLGQPSLPDAKAPNNTGELVLIYQQGRSAEKGINPQSPTLPLFYLRPSVTQKARLMIPGLSIQEDSEKIYDVSHIAMNTLNDAYAALVAKRIAGTAAKYAASQEISKQNEGLGALAWILLNAADQADTRHWSTLPNTIQIVRLRLPAGDHDVTLQGLDSYAQPTGDEKQLKISIKPRKMTFLNWRTIK